MNMKTLILSLFCAVVMSLSFTACSSSNCAAGVACVCEGGSCQDECGGDTGGDCSFQCTDGAQCDNSCPAGGCGMNCTNAESCVLACPGGRCSLNCVGTAECRITECTGTCSLNCGGADTCMSSCDVTDGCSTTP